MDQTAATTMRARKVAYDDYTNAFYVETRVEALQRQVATRAKLTDVINRSHETRLRQQKKQVDAEKEIFEKKTEVETSFHKEQLRDHLAHWHVLQDIARAKDTDRTAGGRDSHLGAYGLGTAKVEIQPLIDRRIKECSPSANRRRKAHKLRKKRKALTLFDRTKSTSALLNMKTQLQSRPPSKALTMPEDLTSTTTREDSVSGRTKQLILPPITVHWARAGQAAETDGVETGARASKHDGGVGITSKEERGEWAREPGLPSIFVTQRLH